MKFPVITNRDKVRMQIVPLVIFTLMAFLWLGDVLVLDKDLSAFDVTMRLPDWKADYEYEGVQQLILSDSPQAHYPERKLKWELMRLGHRVNYNPYIFAGNEDFALGVGSFVSSPFQLFMDVDEAIDWSTWFRLILSAVFMFILLIKLGMNQAASMFGSVLWTYNLHQLVWLELPQHLGTQLWIPLLFYFNYSILKYGFSRTKIAGLLLTNLLFYTSGYIQIVLYTYVAIGIFNTVYLVAQSDRKGLKKFSLWLAIHLLFIVAALFLVPKLIMDSETIAQGLRGAQKTRAGLEPFNLGITTTLDFLKNIFPSSDDLRRILFPDYFGGVWDSKYKGSGNIIEFGAFFGISGVLMLPLGVAGLVKQKQVSLLLAILITLFFSFGVIHGDPVIKGILNIIPMAGFGSYSRFITIIIFLAVILSAAGVNRLTSLTVRKSLVWLVVSGVVLISVCTYLLWVDENNDISKLLFPALVLFSLIVSILIKKLAGNHAAVNFVLTIALVELFLVTSKFNPRVSDERNFAATDTLKLIAADNNVFRVAVLSETPLYPPNTLQYYHLPTIGGYWTTVPVRYISFIGAAYGKSHLTANGMLFLFEGNLKTLRALNVKYIISDREVGGALTPIDNGDNPSYLYKLQDNLERVYCASDLIKYNNESIQRKDLNNLFEAYDRPLSIVSDITSVQRLTDDCSVANLAVNINNVTFKVKAVEDTHVLIPYNYSKHWKARVNGKPITIVKSNYTLMSIPLEKGSSKVKLYYENQINLYFVAAQIFLSILVIILIWKSRTKSFVDIFLIILAITVIVVNLYELPVVRNDNVPENYRNIVGYSVKANSMSS